MATLSLPLIIRFASLSLTRAGTSLLVAAVALLCSCALPSALSDSRQRPATRPPPAAPTTPSPTIPAPVLPAPSQPPAAVTAPAAPPPSVPAPSIIGPPAAVGSTSAPTRGLPSPAATAAAGRMMALVLPLQSSVYGRAADAVRAGFIAAASSAGESARVRVFGHGDDGVLPAVAAANESGAALLVGPLTRDDLKTVIAMAPAWPRTLALNQPEDGSALPADFYALTLAIDSDAVQLARLARDDGVTSIVAVASDAPLQRRFEAAFAVAWERAGGGSMREYRFDPNPEVLRLMRQELSVRAPDALLLAVDGSEAALAKAFLPPAPVYASSQIADDLSPAMLRDLDGVRYVEIPWLAVPDAPAFAALPRANLGNPVLERLYALGLDAYAVAQMLAEPIPPDRIELDGATGHLSLAPSRVFAREGAVMTIRDGQTMVLEGAR